MHRCTAYLPALAFLGDLAVAFAFLAITFFGPVAAAAFLVGALALVAAAFFGLTAAEGAAAFLTVFFCGGRKQMHPKEHQAQKQRAKERGERIALE